MEYIEHLSRDKKLKNLIDQQGPHTLSRYENVCLRLCASIISQQLSTKVAAVIYGRFIGLFNGKDPSPAQILKTDSGKLRSVGLSASKVSYIQNVARFAIERGMQHDKLIRMAPEEVIAYLTEIKGVGRWTAEMLLMFTLGHEDVFAPDDLGIQTAMASIYRLDTADRKKFRGRMETISAKWQPYRTYACLHLWKWKDTRQPVKGTVSAVPSNGKKNLRVKTRVK